MTKLSVIIPAFNEEKTVESVIKKVMSVYIGRLEKEIIIVDDCSTDNTRAVLKSIKGIKFLKQEVNLGRAQRYEQDHSMRQAILS